MDIAKARAVLSVIKEEDGRREELREKNPEFAYDQWLFSDAPFVREFCLLVLVGVRHHIERRLLHFAACAADGGNPIKRKGYEQRLNHLRNLPRQKCWGEIDKRLDVQKHKHYLTIEALRLLANAYKHDPTKSPDEKLLKHLGLNRALNYADLTESQELHRGLASLAGLPENAHYIDITEKLLERVDEFLADIKGRPAISTVDWGPGSLRPSNRLH